MRSGRPRVLLRHHQPLRPGLSEPGSPVPGLPGSLSWAGHRARHPQQFPGQHHPRAVKSQDIRSAAKRS